MSGARVATTIARKSTFGVLLEDGVEQCGGGRAAARRSLRATGGERAIARDPAPDVFHAFAIDWIEQNVREQRVRAAGLQIARPKYGIQRQIGEHAQHVLDIRQRAHRQLTVVDGQSHAEGFFPEIVFDADGDHRLRYCLPFRCECHTNQHAIGQAADEVLAQRLRQAHAAQLSADEVAFGIGHELGRAGRQDAGEQQDQERWRKDALQGLHRYRSVVASR
jgi:hypothetical protein